MKFLSGFSLLLIAGCTERVVPIGWSPTGAFASGESGGAPSENGGSPSESGGLASAGGAQPGAGAAGKAGCARQLVSGDSHVCLLDAASAVWCAGANDLGQLGNGTFNDSPSLSLVPLPPVARIAAGGDHTCAVTTGNQVYCWGDNRAAELGVKGISQSASPVLTLSGKGGQQIVQLVLGQHHSCALDILVHGVCWGTDASSSRVFDVPTPMPQIGHVPFQMLAAGGSRTRVIDSEILFDANWNPTDPLTRVPEIGLGVIDDAISSSHDCVLKRSGTVWCRGGAYPDYYAIVAEFGTDVAEVKVGEGFSCVRTSEGNVSCEGNNGWGQLGGGTLANAQGSIQGFRSVALGPAAELSLGRVHSCARLVDGSVWCWGALKSQASLAQQAEGTPGVRSIPEQLALPDPSGTCADGGVATRTWGPAPSARPIDELNDAIVAWGQNQCRCVSSNEATVKACIRDETPALNGCLQALAPGDQRFSSCLSSDVWSEAVCGAQCIASGSPAIGDCVAVSDCEPRSGAVDFCLQRWLSCHQDGSTLLVNAVDTCNGVEDCANGFDEANCTPAQGQFHCADGARIALELVKNGSRDCADGSDE